MENISRQAIDKMVGEIKAEAAKLQAAIPFASPPLDQVARDGTAHAAQLAGHPGLEYMKNGLDAGNHQWIQMASTWMVTAKGQVDTMRSLREAITGQGG